MTYVYRSGNSVFLIGTPAEFDYLLKFPCVARRIIKSEDEFQFRFRRYLVTMTASDIQKLKRATLEEGLLCLHEDDPQQIVKRLAGRIGFKFWAIELQQDLLDYINQRFSEDSEAARVKQLIQSKRETFEEIAILELEEFAGLAMEKLKTSAEGAGPLPSLADAIAALKSEKDRQAFFKKLGVGDKAKLKIINRKAYIVLTGRAGLRPFLTGTIYSLSNMKVAKVGLSVAEKLSGLKQGIKLNIYFTAPIEILLTALDDKRQWHDLLGTFATVGIISVITQLIMWIIGAGAALVFGMGALSAGALIIGTLIVAGGLSYAADKIDLDDKINSYLEGAATSIKNGWARLNEKIEKEIMTRSDVPHRKLNQKLIEESLMHNFYPDLMKYYR